MVITLTAASIAVLSAALVTGCGKSGSSEGGNKEDNKLNVYNWGEYIDEDVISQFSGSSLYSISFPKDYTPFYVTLQIYS